MSDYYGLGDTTFQDLVKSTRANNVKPNSVKPASGNQGGSWWDNLFGGNKSGLGYTLGSNGNGAYNVSNGGNSYTYSNAAEAAEALDDLNFGTGQKGLGQTGLAKSGEQGGIGKFFGSDTFKGLSTVAGIGTDVWGILNQRKALKQAEKQWEAENARANEIMAMNREKYNTFKADRARLDSAYKGA